MLSIDLRAGCFQPTIQQYSCWLRASSLLSENLYEAFRIVSDDSFIRIVIDDLDQLYSHMADPSVSLDEFRAIFSSLSAIPFAFLSYAEKYLGLSIDF